MKAVGVKDVSLSYEGNGRRVGKSVAVGCRMRHNSKQNRVDAYSQPREGYPRLNEQRLVLSTNCEEICSPAEDGSLDAHMCIAVVRPILQYGFIVWWQVLSKKHNRLELNRIQRIA